MNISRYISVNGVSEILGKVGETYRAANYMYLARGSTT